MEVAFLLVVALTTTMAVPVVGALLIFSLLISPGAAARCFTNKPLTAMGLSVLIALGTVWSAIALSFLSNLPIGFFVGSIGAATYAAGRGWAGWRRSRPASPLTARTLPGAIAG
jgi:zinc/manganese transport system permease protein